MSWGTDLWDQLERLIDHVHKGIEFCDHYHDFLKDRCKAELTYAKELRRMAKSHQPTKKKDEDEITPTCTVSYCGMLKEVTDMAGQHEAIVEGIQIKIIKVLQALISELKTERKKCQEEGKRLQTALDAQCQALQKAKKRYEVAFREAEKAHEMRVRAEGDQALSRADLERVRLTAAQRCQAASDAKADYASVLQGTNEYQRNHYRTLLPQLVTQLQALEEKRVSQVKAMLSESGRVEADVQPIITLCLSGIAKASEEISVSEDVRLVVDKYKTGLLPPDDFPFEDLGAEDGSTVSVSHGGGSLGSLSSSGGGGGANTPKKMDPLVSVRDKKKERGGLLGGIFSSKPKVEEIKEDFSHLPPQQQKKQLSKKIQELKGHMEKLAKERSGIEKMIAIYSQNPSLGDAKVVEKERDEKQMKLEALVLELHKYEEYLVQTERSSTSAGDAQAVPRSPYKGKDSSGWDGSDSAAKRDKSAAAERHNSAEYDSFDDESDSTSNPANEIGKARALYPFQPTNDGSVGLDGDELVTVLELDMGDGWTMVRRANGEDGFVPTSYIQLS